MEREGTAKGPTMGKVKSAINDLKQENVTVGSVSGSLSHYVRSWVKTIPKETLEFFSLTFPKQPWRDLANLIHLHPSDFQLEW